MELTPQELLLLEKAVREELTSEEYAQLECLLLSNPLAEYKLKKLSEPSIDSEVLQHLSSSSLSHSPSITKLILDLQQYGRDGLAHAAGAPSREDASFPDWQPDNLLLIRKIGQGGMGVVYEGFDKDLGRSVAVKFLAHGLAQNENAKRLLIGEAKAAAQLQHENIVTIHAIHLNGENPFLIQQFVPGESLGQRIRRLGKLEKQELVKLTIQIARGLAAAHNIGLIHRDLKPDNVLLDSLAATARIADFGLAVRQGLGDDRNNSEGLAGTPAYMSPEQTRGDAVDARSDLFSFGCVLYAAAVGKSPFGGHDTKSVMKSVCEETPPSLSLLRPDLPRWWTLSVGKLMQKDPAKRFQSTHEFVKYIEIAQSREKSANRTMAWSAAWLMTMLFVGAIAFFLMRDSRSRTTQQFPHAEQVAESPIWFEVLGDDRHFDSLPNAVAAAPNDSTIRFHGRGEVECEPIELGDKALALTMAEDADITIKPRQSDVFIRTQSKLDLINIKIISDRAGAMDIPFRSTIHGKNCVVRMQGCVIQEKSFIFCLNLESGSAEIRNSLLNSAEACSIAASPTACKIDIKNCYFESNACFMMAPRQASDVSGASSSIHVDQTTLSGRSVVRVLVMRPSQSRFKMQLTNSMDLCQYKVLLTSMTPRLESFSTTSQIVAALERSLVWQEEHCVHKTPEYFVGSIKLVSSSLMNSTQFRTWKDWAKYWGLNPDASISLPVKMVRTNGLYDVNRSEIPIEFQDVGYGMPADRETWK